MYDAGLITADLIRGLYARWRSLFEKLSPPTDALVARLDFLSIPFPAVVAFGLALLALLLAVDIGFSIRDESYLWLGAQRVLAGEVPFRDFQSYYDPGRYYLCAAFMWMLGSHGMVALRVADSLFGAFACGLACWLVFRNFPRPGPWLFVAVLLTLVLWVDPEYKFIDIAGSAVLVALLAWLVEEPSRWRCFAAGAGVGLSAFIVGRNHGLYGAVADVLALGCVLLIERRGSFMPAVGWWAAGVAAGYAPMLLFVLLVPGVWAPFWDGIRLYFVLGTTNLTVPVPWPWHVPHRWPAVEQARYIIVGWLLIMQPLVGFLVAAYSVWTARVQKRPLHAVAFAAGLFALIYTHHAFARAGLGHLRQAILPLLICVFVLVVDLPRIPRLLAATAVCAISAFLLLPQQAFIQRATSDNWALAKIDTDYMWVSPQMDHQLTDFRALVDKYAPGGQEFIAVPHLPGLYAMFDRRPGLWSTYELSPGLDTEQDRDIARIKSEHPVFVIVQDVEQDHREDLAYWNANARVYDYIVHHYVRIRNRDARAGLQLYLAPNSPYAPKGEAEHP